MEKILTLGEIRLIVESQSDNEFEDFKTFVRQWNNIILEIWQSTGLYFDLLDPSKSSEYENTQSEFTTFNNFPREMITTMVSGLTWKILEIEQEDNLFYWEQVFKKNCANLMIFMSAQDDYKKIKTHESNWTTISQDWDE